MPTTVLLVDDEAQILNILKDTLETVGFNVTARESGEAALEYLGHHRPDLMVTDLRMQGISGLELLKQVVDLTPDTQSIILTGFGDMKSAIEALRLGAFDYLNKPIDAERLIQTLKNGDERRRLILENRALIQNLQESNRLKNEFLNGMSHEVRTPLGHITGFSEILETTLEDATEKQVRYIQNIQKAAHRLLNMFDNILQYSRLNSGDASISPKPFALSGLIKKTADEFQDAIHGKGLTLEMAPLEPDVTIAADETICHKILSLLLDNAVQFCPAESRITLKADLLPAPSVSDALKAELADNTAEAWVHLSVSDTGPGIVPEDQERIFNLFEQGDGSLTRHHEGAGLGLSLARSLARLHNGVIHLDSTPGEGSTFTLVVPLETPV